MVERLGWPAAGAAVSGYVLLGAVLAGEPWARSLGLAALACVVAGLLAWRRPRGWPLIAGLVALVLLVAAVCGPQSSNVGFFSVCVVAAWAALVEPFARSVVVAAVAVAIFGVLWAAVEPDPGWGAWIGGTLFTVLACSMARRQRQLLEELRAAQASLAEQARAEERTRIAHEMHDVIGHALTVSLLHVSSARLALADDPEEAERSLVEAERLAQQSLAEVRASVGQMRETSARTPLPGGGDVDELIESFRRAGTAVRAEVSGDLGRLTATEGLTVYRILQEALTNVARHAPGSAAEVSIEVGDSETLVRVDSDGPPGTRREGSGLVGMRERAAALGGRVVAGPRPGGWRVEGVLPR